jgi:hypothetical protein
MRGLRKKFWKLKIGIDLTANCNDITVSERRYMI